MIESKKVEWVTFNIRKEIKKAFEVLEKELAAVMGEPEMGKQLEKPTITESEKGDEFFEWLISEFQITREEYEKLDDDIKKFRFMEYSLVTRKFCPVSLAFWANSCPLEAHVYLLLLEEPLLRISRTP